MPNDEEPNGRLIQEVADAALPGLLAARKTLPPKLFYDEEGCRLFYRITELPEYYLTRAEREPLARAADHVATLDLFDATLVEFGASSEAKALTLLRAPTRDGRLPFVRYVPIDIAGPELAAMKPRLNKALPSLMVLPVAGDFTRDLTLPPAIQATDAVGFFPGSTIGNLEPDEARAFLNRARIALGRRPWLILGADLRKDPAILIPAYDDAAGVTAAFNRNLLVRLNREAGATFDPGNFRHQAVWNDAESRIEMHLVSLRAQTVRIAGHEIRFAEGETIHTENSYKHTIEAIAAIAAAAGWRLSRIWTDAASRFGVFLFDT